MISSMVRTLKTRQIGLVQTYHLISGTAATPADSGIDKAYVSTVADGGVGLYTITFKQPSRLDIAVVGFACVTADRILTISAVDKESVTIEAVDMAGAAADADFYLTCVHSTQLNYTF